MKILLIALLTSLAGVVLVGVIGGVFTVIAFDDFIRDNKQEAFESILLKLSTTRDSKEHEFPKQNL